MKKERIDITGNKYNRLLVKSYAYTKNNFAYWNCLCDCGKKVVVRGCSLKNGNTHSCGCLNNENRINRNKLPRTEKTREKISKSLKGNIPWNKGKTGLQVCWSKGKKRPEISGENNYNWNPNLTDEDRQKNRTHLPEHIEWRKKVFARDNYQCVICGSKKKLNAHHIYPFSPKGRRNDFKYIRYESWNGITLCKNCHDPFTNKELQMSYVFIPHLREHMN